MTGGEASRLIGDVVQDVRYGLRKLRHSPGFTLVAVLTLALGIGANTALFSLLDAALLKRLPVSHPEQLVSVIVTTRTAWMTNVPSPLFDALRTAPRAFSGVFAFWQERANVRFDREVERAAVQLVSGDYYSTLRVPAFLGRLVGPEDQAAGSGSVAVLGYEFWVRRFASDRAALGKTIVVDGIPRTIIGITPRGFFGMDRGVTPDVTVPLGDPLRFSNLWVMGRRRPDVSLGQARAETELAWQRAAEALRPSLERFRKADRDEILSQRADLLPGENGGGGLRLRNQVGSLRTLLLLSGVVLLIACANVANLLLARGSARSAEIGTLLAIGASRGRLIRQLLVENGLLSLFGGFLGLAVGFWAHRVLVAFMIGDLAPVGVEFTLDSRVLGFTLGVSTMTALLFGLAPALRATREGIVPALKPAAGVSSRRGRIGFRGGLLVAQLAASVVLLAAGALLARSLINLRAVDRGFSTADVVLINVGTSETPYAGDRARVFYEGLISRAEMVPGVVSASLGANTIFGSGHWEKSIWVQGRAADESQSAVFNVVTPGFFSTTGLPLLLGRDFSVHDRPNSAPVAIVNEAFARRYCPEHPVGCRFGDRGPESSGKYEVIGIVKNAKYGALREDYEPMIYLALLQEDRASSVVLHVRAKEGALAIAARMRDELRAVDQTIPVYGARSMNAQIDESLSGDRLLALLSSFFAVLAALLSGMGVFGIVANGVQGRRREIGVRMALGARRPDVLRLILSQTILLVSIGAVAGVALALLSTRLLAGSLFGLAPTDPATLSGAVLFLLVLSGVAAYVPARRAATLDPMVVLRQE